MQYLFWYNFIKKKNTEFLMLCNFILDSETRSSILQEENLKIIQNFFLKTEKADVALNILCMFYQLLITLSQDQRPNILTADVLRKVQYWTSHITDKRVHNIALLIIEDFGRRHEIIEFNKPMVQ